MINIEWYKLGLRICLKIKIREAGRWLTHLLLLDFFLYQRAVYTSVLTSDSQNKHGHYNAAGVSMWCEREVLGRLEVFSSG